MPCSTPCSSRVGVNALMIGTISWLGLKVGRRISTELEGWPDHGVPAPYTMQGGATSSRRPEYYADTFIKVSPRAIPRWAGSDILELVVPKAKARGHEGHPRIHGAAVQVCRPWLGGGGESPTCRNASRSIFSAAVAGEPCTCNPDYRRWWHGIVEEHCAPTTSTASCGATSATRRWTG